MLTNQVYFVSKDSCTDDKKQENTLSSGKVAQPAEQLKLVKVKLNKLFVFQCNLLFRHL